MKSILKSLNTSAGQSEVTGQ